MAILSIVQQENGWSARGRAGVADYLGMAADGRARGHDLLQHVQPAAGGQVQAQRLHPTCRASCATVRRRAAHLEQKLGIKMGMTTADGLFTLQQTECLGACADSPVMLVNDRHMCSFMNNAASTS